MDQLLKLFESLIDPIFVLLVLIILLILNAWIFKRLKSATSKSNITRRTISFILILVGTLIFILSLTQLSLAQSEGSLVDQCCVRQ